MTIRISEREQPREQEMRKQLRRFEQISKETLADGTVKEVIMTPSGKITRIFDPLTNKLIQQLNHSFRMGQLDEEKTEEVQQIPQEQVVPSNLSNMNLSQIARVIKGDWKRIYFGSVPYVDAMRTMNKITDNYGHDSGTSIIAYFLGNATTWKGPIARAVKKELNDRLKRAYRRK